MPDLNLPGLFGPAIVGLMAGLCLTLSGVLGLAYAHRPRPGQPPYRRPVNIAYVVCGVIITSAWAVVLAVAAS